MLVCLAACIAMLQVNWLLPLAGRPSNSFVMKDLMRLPLGILSGMGFIGAGRAGPDEAEIRGILQNAGFRVLSFALAATRGADSRVEL